MRTYLLSCFFLTLLACGGGDGPSISAITPRHVFPARSVEIVIAGNNTHFDEATTVDFGPDIDVTSLTVVSPTQIVCDVDIALSAAIGSRDIKATTGREVVVGNQGLSVDASLAVDMLDNSSVVQGSVFRIALSSLDPDQPMQFPNSAPDALAFNHIDGVSIVSLGYGAANGVVRLGALVAVDVFATPGPRAILLQAPGSLNNALASDATELTILPAEPTPITVPLSTAIVFDTQSKTYSLQVNQGGILSVTTGLDYGWAALAKSDGMIRVPVAIGYAFTPVFYSPNIAGASRPGDTYYLALGRADGVDPTQNVALEVVHTPATVTPETPGLHDCDAPQTLSMPTIVDGTLANEGDCYALATAPGATVELSVTANSPSHVFFAFYPPSYVPGPGIHVNPELNGTFESVTFRHTNSQLDPDSYYLVVQAADAATSYTITARVL